MKAPRLLFFRLSVTFMYTATNMAATCRRTIKLGQKKTVGTKRTDSLWLLLYTVLITTKPLLAIYIPRIQPLTLVFLTHVSARRL